MVKLSEVSTLIEILSRFRFTLQCRVTTLRLYSFFCTTFPLFSYHRKMDIIGRGFGRVVSWFFLVESDVQEGPFVPLQP